MSLVPKIGIADGDDQSETIVSWLLIMLSLTLWLMAFVQCFWEVSYVRSEPHSVLWPLAYEFIILAYRFGT